VLTALLGYDLPKLKEILLYHVASGSVASTDLSDGQMVTSVNTAGNKISVGIAAEVVSLNGASTVTSADVMATNGVIHVLDTVITPPGMALPMNIVETAVSMPDTFSTLVAALTAANLVDTLSGDGPFTVFAPTDAAFAELPTATLT
jgi:transforming growth factor-beta-induced protein